MATTPGVAQEQTGRFSRLKRLFSTTKRAAAFGASFALLSILIFLILGWSFSQYENRRTEVRTWPDIHLPNGLTLSLKSQARDRAVRIQFSATASTEDGRAELESAANDLGNVSFTVVFSDSAGFQTCKAKVKDLTQMIGSSNKVEGLESNSTLEYCSVSDYVSSEKWNILYVLPTPRKLTPEQPSEAKELPAPGHISEADKISGVSYVYGNVDTVAGYSFHVGSEAETNTLVLWSAGDSLTLKCKGRSCTVANVSRSETVHARRIR